VCERLLEVGLVTYETHQRVVRLAPPLVVTRADVDWALERIEQGFRGL
jgi:ornithine--oxo-acid transaminase